MRVTLTKQQALVAKATAPHPFRQSVGVVRIGDGRIVSADGFVMAKAPVDHDGDPVYVPARMIDGPCDVELEGESLRVVTTQGTREAKHGVPEYPDINRVWRDALGRRKPRACIALNVALLQKMLRCIEGKDGWKGRSGIVRLYVRRPNDALEWRVEDAEGKPIVEGLIMPMFVGWGEK